MSDPAEIMALTREGAQVLEANAKAGDPDAVRDFVYYALYRSLEHNPGVPPADRLRVYSELVGLLRVNVTVEGRANG